MIQTDKGIDWLVGKAKKGQVWCALLSLSLALSLASTLTGPTARADDGPGLLEDRAIDPGLAETSGATIDTSPPFQYSMVLAGSFLAFFLLCGLLNGWIEGDLEGEFVDSERTGILILSQISLAVAALQLIVGEAIPGTLRGVLHLICWLLVLSMVAKRLVSQGLKNDRDWGLVWSILNDSHLMLALLFLAGVLLSIGGLAGGSLQPTTGWPLLLAFALYLSVLVLLLASYALIARHVAARERGGRVLSLYDLNTAVIAAGAPLSLIPLGGLLANELQFAVPVFDARALALAVAAVLVTVSAAVFILQRRGRIRIGGVGIFAWFYFPVTVATLASFQTHRWTLNLGNLESLGTGTRILPAQQWAQFGSVPFLDLVPGQGLADVAFQTLYIWIHGMRGFDFVVWLPWIPVVAGFVLVYAYLATVTSPLLAVLVTLFLPVSLLVNGQYAVALLPAIVLVPALRKPVFRRFLLLWLTTAALLLWRPALGGLAAAAILLVVVLVAMLESRNLVIPAAVSLAAVVGLLPVTLLVAEVVWSGDTYAVLVEYLGLLIRPGVGSLGAIQASSGMQTSLSFLQSFLPVVAVICVLSVLLRRFVRQQSVTPGVYAILYLVVFSFMMPPRVGVRSTALLFDPSYLLLALALMPFLVVRQSYRPRHIGRSAWLLVILVMGSFLGSVEIYHLLGGATDEGRLRNWKPGESRVFFDSRSHQPVLDFLQTDLEGDQTFLDFTGNPALYSLASQRYPLRQITDFRQTSESRQQSEIALLEQLRTNGLLPWVVYRSPLHSGGKPLFPPTEVLSYRVAEFVYTHYSPYAEVGMWEIWKGRGLRKGKPKPPAGAVSSRSIRQDFRLGNLPFRWAREDPWQAVRKTKIVASPLSRPMVVQPGAPLELPWSPGADTPVATYLHLRARPLSGGKPGLTVLYGPQSKSTFNFQLVNGRPRLAKENQRINLEQIESPRRHSVKRLPDLPGRRVFRAGRRDPWLLRFVDLSPITALEEGTEQWVTVWYHSRGGGTAQIYFAAEGEPLSEPHSVKMTWKPTRQAAGPRMVSVPIVGVEVGARLGKLRLDPPAGDEFEIVAMEWNRHPSLSDDYLIRLTTQYQWTQGGPHPLTLRSDVPVLVESVHLRTGD